MNINLITLSNSINKDSSIIKQDAKNFVDEINNNLFENDLTLVEGAKDGFFDVVFIASGGTESKFLDLLPSLKEPIILLSHGKNNSLPACFEIKTYLFQKNIQCLLASDDEISLSSFLTGLSSIYHILHSTINTSLGVIGKPSDWLISSSVDYQKAKDKFGINLIDISMDELFIEIDKHKYDKVPHLRTLQNKVKDSKRLEMALYIYGALKRIVDKYNLKGLTIRCFDLLSKYHGTACLALSLLNEEGIVCSCEGDVPTLITMYLVYIASCRPSFQANPSTTSFANNTLLLAHCTAPINMLSSYELPTHFESDEGIGIKGEFKTSQVDIIKLHPDLSHLSTFSGTIEKNCSYPSYCRSQILVKLEEGDILRLFNEPFANHLVVSYDRVNDVISNANDFLETIYNGKKHE